MLEDPFQQIERGIGV